MHRVYTLIQVGLALFFLQTVTQRLTFRYKVYKKRMCNLILDIIQTSLISFISNLDT